MPDPRDRLGISFDRCPVCGASISGPLPALRGQLLCPSCGKKLWFIAGRSVLYSYSPDESPPNVLEGLARLRNELGMDSLDLVEFILELEDEFGEQFPDVLRRIEDDDDRGERPPDGWPPAPA